MQKDQVVRGFRAEAERLAQVVAEVAEHDFRRPTGCAPWTVGELCGHLHQGVARIGTMLDQPAADSAEVSAAGYYRRDGRFSPVTDADRIVSAQRAAAAYPTGRALLAAFDAAWRSAARRAEGEHAGRVVRTRHGDRMLFTDFLVTRVVELAVHGLDLASALGRPAWLTAEAAEVVEELLLGAERPARPLGWDGLTFLQQATGRMALTPSERGELDRAGVRWLVLRG